MVVFNSNGFETTRRKMSRKGSEVLMSKAKSPVQKPARKKWSLQGGDMSIDYTSKQEEKPKKYDQENILLRLRSQLAEDGCPESQLQVARTFLQMEKTDGNTQHAVHWLLQASLQGNIEATKMLKNCLENNVGVTEDNFLQIKHCLALDEQEKAARGAIKQLFYRCCFGSSYITLHKLNILVQKIYEHGTTQADEIQLDDHEISMGSLKKKYGSQKLSEKELTAAATQFTRGFMPAIRLESPQYSKVEWILDKPMTQLINCIHACGQTLLKHTVMMSVFLFVIALVMLSWSQLIYVGVQVLLICSCMIILFSIVGVVKLQLEYKHFLVWSTLLKHLSESLDNEKAQEKFRHRFWFFYMTVFFTFCIYVTLSPVLDPSLLHFILPISLGIWFVSLVQSLKVLKIQGWISFICLILICQPYSGFGIVESITRYAGIEQLSIERMLVFEHLHVGLTASTFYLVCWLACTIVLMLSHDIDVGFLHVIACAPLYMSWHAFTTIKNSEQEPTFWSEHWLISFLCLLATFVSNSLSSSMRPIIRWSFRCCLLAFGLLGLVTFCIPSKPHGVPPLTWETYLDICHPRDSLSNIQLLERCRLLEGSTIEWKGTIKRIEASTSNVVEDMISLLPFPVQPKLRCLFSWTDRRSSNSDALYEVATKHANACMLTGWDRYNFEVSVSVGSPFWKSNPQDLILHADSSFKNIILHLSTNDLVSFQGILFGNEISDLFKLRVSSIKCLDCKHIPESVASSTAWEILRRTTLYNFFMNLLETEKKL